MIKAQNLKNMQINMERVDMIVHISKYGSLYHGDCLQVMKGIPDKSIDMILCDLPYGTTACKWDSIIPFEPLWLQYERIIKDNGAIVLTATQPFASKLILSNLNNFKYEWIWVKSRPFDIMNAKNKPMSKHESILIFSKGTVASCSKKLMKYYPQGLIECNKIKKGRLFNKTDANGHSMARPSTQKDYIQKYTNYPNSVLSFESERKAIHPTQKPVALFEYLIKTYTNESELVLDNCIGSGTTAIACISTNRKYIGIEKDDKYIEVVKKRIVEHEVKHEIIG